MGGDSYHLTPEQAVQCFDENTIGVIAVFGSTVDGSYEPIAEICAALDKLQADTGLDVPVHVDGASGGFVAAFIDLDIERDFRLPRVHEECGARLHEESSGVVPLRRAVNIDEPVPAQLYAYPLARSHRSEKKPKQGGIANVMSR